MSSFWELIHEREAVAIAEKRQADAMALDEHLRDDCTACGKSRPNCLFGVCLDCFGEGERRRHEAAGRNWETPVTSSTTPDAVSVVNP
jgi:hypothetical protein